MLRKLAFIGLIIVFVVYMTGAHVFALDEKALEKKSNLIAKLLVSCRAIIAQNQDLFNNPNFGDKGFTGDVYVNKGISICATCLHKTCLS